MVELATLQIARSDKGLENPPAHSPRRISLPITWFYAICAIVAANLLFTEPVLGAGLAKGVVRGAAKRIIAGKAVKPSVARGIMRGATKSSVSAGSLKPSQILRKDLLNHRLTKPQPLLRSRTVQRFTTLKRAHSELRRGIAPNTHMTAVARSGRPLSPLRAGSRYGLPRTPQVRETIRLPKGFPVRHNRAVGASRGVRELTSPLHVPSTSIRKLVKLR